MAHASMLPRLLFCVAVAMLLVLSGCGRETRDEALAPRTEPTGTNDPRIPYFDLNAYQIAKGRRYATWYGCLSCHGEQAEGVLNLIDAYWYHGSEFTDIYRSIARGHSPTTLYHGERVPVSQLWQMTAYVRDLNRSGMERIRRQTLDQAAEPQGEHWDGPLR